MTRKLVCKECAAKTGLPIVAQGSWRTNCVGCGAGNYQAYEIVNTKKATKAPTTYGTKSKGSSALCVVCSDAVGEDLGGDQKVVAKKAGLSYSTQDGHDPVGDGT